MLIVDSYCKSSCFLSLIRQKAGMAASRATAPHAKNIACTPRKSARMPKNNGAMVFATLVESELMLYADSYSALPTDSAIIVLVIGTVPFVKKPRTRASIDIMIIDGVRARIESEMKCIFHSI